MKTLEMLKSEILEDGIIDAKEVKEIESTIYADGKIDKEEADFLFELNDAVSGKNNHSSWEGLFVKAITSFVLDDEGSPDEIDEDETQYLLEKIQGDGHIDEVELALLKNIEKQAKGLPNKLKELIK